MARYIDADEFKSHLENAMKKMHFVCGVKCVDVGAVIKALDMQPTADVVEVKHGEWVWKSNGYIKRLFCSCCNGEEDWTSTFCPHCGAKMDEERKEE